MPVHPRVALWAIKPEKQNKTKNKQTDKQFEKQLKKTNKTS